MKPNMKPLALLHYMAQEVFKGTALSLTLELIKRLQHGCMYD